MRVFDSWPASKKQAPRSVRCLARLHRITLDQGIVHETRDQTPNRVTRPLFPSPHLTCFALARARSGPDARDEWALNKRARAFVPVPR